MTNATTRTSHLAEFFASAEFVASGTSAEDARPIGVVMGNCQAESLRLTLGDDVRFVRTPPVHELEPSDLPFLETLLGRTAFFVSQPVREGYRGLPVGTRELMGKLHPGARTALFPVIRFAGLYPFQAIIRPPSNTSLAPPLVPYHDLRTLAEAGQVDALPRAATRGAVAAIAAESTAQLRAREEHHGTVPVSDLLARPSFALFRTINHPGNPVWLETAARVRGRLGLPEIQLTLDREILTSIHAPREQSVIDAWHLDANATSTWTVDGQELDPDRIRAAHLAWYRDHPDAVTEGLSRHAAAMNVLRAA